MTQIKQTSRSWQSQKNITDPKRRRRRHRIWTPAIPLRCERVQVLELEIPNNEGPYDDADARPLPLRLVRPVNSRFRSAGTRCAVLLDDCAECLDAVWRADEQEMGTKEIRFDCCCGVRMSPLLLLLSQAAMRFERCNCGLEADDGVIQIGKGRGGSNRPVEQHDYSEHVPG